MLGKLLGCGARGGGGIGTLTSDNDVSAWSVRGRDNVADD